MKPLSSKRNGFGEIDVAPFQARLLELHGAGTTFSSIARRLGYVDCNGKPDTSRVKRDVGLRDDYSPTWQGRRRALTYEKAVQFCLALELDPAEVGV
jgi:hypothetical protein